MRTTLSRDGTKIAYDTAGSGPLLVLVDGALCTRRIGPGKGLARLLAGHFTVINYDRRGRGDSGDAGAYDVEREVEDLLAVIEAGGGQAFVFGQSSGAVLALHAAARFPQITRLAVYEAPFIVDDTRAPTGPAYHQKLTDLLARGQRGPAVELFLRLVGLPKLLIAGMRFTPYWPRLKAVAPTLCYDSLITIEHQQGRPLSTRLVGRRHTADAGALRGRQRRVDAKRDAGARRHPPRRDPPHAGRSNAQPTTQGRRAPPRWVLPRCARTGRGQPRRGGPLRGGDMSGWAA